MSIIAQVFLRNGEAATLSGTCDLPTYRLTGRRGMGTFELWTATGRWRDDNQDHPLDVTAIVHGGVTVPFLGLQK